ncbi:MAG: single-stranded-DNA-specific exonuclease RecJ [Bacteroidetes bacterium]|nr:single-stranded-DNA-specific exonuclease RecJ [Bacteroidota bacterium]
MAKRWKILSHEKPEAVALLQELLGVDRVVANLLVQRGILNYDDSKAFFRPTYDMLHDPFLMKGMDKAIDRITKAIQNNEKIMVYGDYDVDGTTSVALVYSFFKQFYANVGYYIPDRYAEGYGISFKGIDYAKEHGYSLIIALDCGIKAVDKVAYANEKQVDFIICDHHLPGDEIPAALAVLDPKQIDCPYPYKELAGCGIGFKLAQAYTIRHHMNPESVYQYLDLVVTSIAADIVPITGENRVLAFYGLKQLNKEPRPGIKALLTINKIDRELDISTLVFVIGPRINAAGRLEHGSKAVDLLVSQNEVDAMEIAQAVNNTNSQRRDLDFGTTDEALQLLEQDPMTPFRKSTVLFSETWHKGVIGIVASRLIEKYYRPTIVLTESGGKATGSARSVKDFDVYSAIEKCSDLLEQFGGHKFAAGLTLKKENVTAFRNRFEDIVSASITDDMLQPEIEIDLEISLDEISDKLVRILKQFAPHGPHNMTPLFCSRGVLDTGFVRIVGNNHLKLELYQPGTQLQKMQAIAYDKGDFAHFFQKQIPMDIVYKIKENEYRGHVSVQLMIEDIRPAQ